MISVAGSKVMAPLATFAIAAGATWAWVGDAMGPQPAEPRAWFDEPLDGLTVAPGDTVEIVAHATDRDGVELVRITAEGDEVETLTGGGHSLVTVEVTWSPPGAGTYLLEVVGIDGENDEGEPGAATVVVSETAFEEPVGDQVAAPPTSAPDPGETTTTTSVDDSTTSTSVRGSGPGPGPTVTTPTTRPPVTTTTTGPGPTTTQPPPCPVAPTLVGPPNGTSPRIQPQLRWAYDGCLIDGFLVEVMSPQWPQPQRVSLPAGTTQWAPPDGFACGNPAIDYSWRVAAVRARNQVWSTTWTFRMLC